MPSLGHPMKKTGCLNLFLWDGKIGQQFCTSSNALRLGSEGGWGGECCAAISPVCTASARVAETDELLSIQIFEIKKKNNVSVNSFKFRPNGSSFKF